MRGTDPALVEKPVIAQERGSALVITLLVITTLVGMTVAFSEDSNVELSLAAYSRGGFIANQAASAGYHMATALLKKDAEKEEERPYDSLREDWAKFGSDSVPEEILGDAVLSGSIVDENSKFNLNLLRKEDGDIEEKGKERLSRLFKALGLEEQLAIPLLDWLDADDEKRLEGAESIYYQSLPQPYACGNGPFLTIGQIFLVRELAKLQQFGENGEKRIMDFLTIYSDGKVNINTASVEVIQSLDDGIDRPTAEAIVEYRKEQDFSTVEDLKKVPSVSDELFGRVKDVITVKSSAFMLEMEGKYQEARSTLRAVLLKDNGQFKVMYWRVL